MSVAELPRKTREMHSNHFDSTIWNDFKFRDDDVVIATYAKSGTTWTQQIIGQILFNGREDVNVAEENKRLFKQFFGDNFAQIEDDLLKHLKGLPYVDPVANQTHYVIMLDGQALRSARVTSSPAAVRKWQEETMATMTPAARSQSNFQVLPFANRDLAEEYAKQWLHAR